MAYVIIGDLFSFPEGDSSTNRVHTYAKGFYENSINVHVICFANEYTTLGEGLINGIHYYHPFGQIKRSENFIKRSWLKILKYFKTVALLRKINKTEKIDVIIVYSLFFGTFLFAWFLTKVTNSKLIQESGEHPLRRHQNGTLNKQLGFIKLKIESGLCDGIFCISQFLVDFYKNQGLLSHKLILVPSTVDPARFTQTGEKPFPFLYIGYFGGLTFKRDNIDLLIEAFAVITIKFPAMHLVLGGFCSDNEKKQIENLISDLKISEKVSLLKYLPRQEIIQYIIHSDILVMVRSNDLESQASFPSKLTEYLVTSKPVITVNVGEISEYLTDGVNSFLVEPGNKNELAEKLDNVLNDYEAALKIGERGKQLTDTTFNYNYQAKRIIQFVKTL